MKKNVMLVALALGVAACADVAPGGHAETQDEDQALGDLTLNLVGSDSDGRQYRLRNAVFGVSGSPEFPMPIADGGYYGYYETISTETDPDAPVISLRVVPGFYYVSLESADWYLERVNAQGGWDRVEQAVLLSSQYQYAYVYNGTVTSIAFRFGVDGEFIDFRSGELQVGIEIEQPGEGPGGGFPDAGGGFGGLLGGLGGGTGGGFLGGGFDAGAPPMGAADAGVATPPSE